MEMRHPRVSVDVGVKSGSEGGGEARTHWLLYAAEMPAIELHKWVHESARKSGRRERAIAGARETG